MDWKLFNVIILGLGFMFTFTSFNTTSMCSKLVTSSLKLETINNSTDFDVTFNNRKMDIKFMKRYEAENRKIHIDKHREDKSKNQTWSEDQIIDHKIKMDLVNSQYGDGYTSLSIVYAVFAVSEFLSVAIVKICGHKLTLFLSSLTYLNYVCMFLFPTPAYMYTASILIGLGAACIWTAQGEFLHLQSTTERLMSRNTGIFTSLFQSSLLIGNLYIYFAWRGRDYVDTTMRTTVFTVFGVVCGIGATLFLTLNTTSQNKIAPAAEEPAYLEDSNRANCNNIIVTIGNRFLKSIMESVKLLFTKEMLLCMSLFMYEGLVISFYSGVYPTAIGNSKTMPEQMGTVGLVGVFTGVGEIVGSSLFVFGSRFTNKVPRPIVLVCCLVIHLIACVGILINLPLQANMVVVEEGPCILGCILEKSNQIIAVVTAFLLGFGDAGVLNVIYTTISEVWSTNSAPAFAIMKCLESVAIAIVFALAAKINLLWNTVILIVFAVLSILTYIPLYYDTKQRKMASDLAT